MKPRTPKGSTRPAKEVAEDLSVPVWVDPHLTPAFYKRLNAIASTCQAPRYQVLQGVAGGTLRLDLTIL